MAEQTETPSQRTATNIRRLRTRLGMTYAELARRLAANGHTIPVLGLRRIEQHERRVDVNDLDAIAAVFGIDPAQLAYTTDPTCAACGNEPPAGFTCNLCGSQTARQSTVSADTGNHWE